jgi:formylglycine-generating enzyme required for sulfatase activity
LNAVVLVRFVFFAAAVSVVFASGCAALSGLGDLEIEPCDGSDCTGGSRDASLVDAYSGADQHAPLGVDAGTDTAPSLTDALPPVVDSPTGDAPVTTPDGGDAAIPTGPCSGDAGPKSVRVGSFCIDSTEVTNAEYATFLAANPPVSLGGSACAFKPNFTPAQGWPVAAAKTSFPVVYVDWCDAYAYCAWAGKRLCGAIGGGASARASVANKAVDEWYAACSMNGADVFPYGSQTYVSGKCNDLEGAANSLRAVGSLTGCQGGYPGIFDMNGNAWEWEDACDVNAGASDACLIRGGSFLFSGASYGGCPTYFNDYVIKRSDTYNDTGFRCCSN